MRLLTVSPELAGQSDGDVIFELHYLGYVSSVDSTTTEVVLFLGIDLGNSKAYHS